MGVFSRARSPYWWLWLETAPPGAKREKTDIKIGSTVAQRKDSQRLAEDVYHQRMNELASRIHRLPIAKADARFDAYATIYEADVISQHKGKERERELLKPLRAYFEKTSIKSLDRDQARAYMTARRLTVSARTVNREIDLLKAMLRDAVPKYLEASPLVGMKRLAIVPPKRHLLTPADERKLLRAAKDPQDKALLILGIDTLVRMGDLLDLQRSDRVGPWIYIRDPKGGESYEVPLSPRAVNALNAIKGDSIYFFQKFRVAEKPRDWRGSVRQRLEYLCREADVKFGKAENGITFHWATRRTGATRLLVKKNEPLAVVQRLGNWKKPDVLLEIYTEADRQDLLKAVGQKAAIAQPPHSHSRRKVGQKARQSGR